MNYLLKTKFLGTAGGLLIGLSIIPFFGWIVRILGLVLSLLAVKYVSEEVKNKLIFRNMRIAVILAGISTILGSTSVMPKISSLLVPPNFFGAISPSFNINELNISSWGILEGLPIDIDLFIPWILPLISIGIFIISAFYLKRTLNIISTSLGIGRFKTSGQLFVNGAITLWIGIGSYVVALAALVLASAFYSIPKHPQIESKPQRNSIKIILRIIEKFGGPTKILFIILISILSSLALLANSGSLTLDTMFTLFMPLILGWTFLLLFIEVATMEIRDWTDPLVLLYRVP